MHRTGVFEIDGHEESEIICPSGGRAPKSGQLENRRSDCQTSSCNMVDLNFIVNNIVADFVIFASFTSLSYCRRMTASQ